MNSKESSGFNKSKTHFELTIFDSTHSEVLKIPLTSDQAKSAHDLIPAPVSFRSNSDEPFEILATIEGHDTVAKDGATLEIDLEIWNESAPLELHLANPVEK